MSEAILAIESSCDETSAAVIVDGEVASLLISSQPEHSEWGGVVPELASRSHLKAIVPMISGAMKKADVSYPDLKAIAVTTEPGLIGSLLVGVNTAKGLAVGLGIPLIPVNHIEAHLLSVLIEHKEIEFPFLGLVVSGGHTLMFDVKQAGEYELLGATRDDAAGEAFDKGAKLLGLGYPGGPLLDKHAREGDPKAHDFPRGLLSDSSNDFSFSGLKTSLRYFLRDNYPSGSPAGKELADICASYQESIVDVLARKTLRAAQKLGRDRVVIVGGVSVNSRLRAVMKERGEKKGIQSFTTSPVYSTDNAAMIGMVGWLKYQNKSFGDVTVTARAALDVAKQKKGKKQHAPFASGV